MKRKTVLEIRQMKSMRKIWQLLKLMHCLNQRSKFLVGLSYTIGIGYGAFLVFNQAISLGDLVSFNVYLGMLIWPMFAVGELINVLQRGNASLDRVNDILHYQADVKNREDPIMLTDVKDCF